MTVVVKWKLKEKNTISTAIFKNTIISLGQRAQSKFCEPTFFFQTTIYFVVATDSCMTKSGTTKFRLNGWNIKCIMCYHWNLNSDLHNNKVQYWPLDYKHVFNIFTRTELYKNLNKKNDISTKFLYIWWKFSKSWKR